MRRSIALISAAVTAFSLVILASVVYAYQVMAAPRPTVAQVASQPVVLQQAASAPATSANLSPQNAASVAAKLLNRTDVYSVELADFNGAQSYKVTFSSGDVVYVGLDGQVLGTVPAATTVANSMPLKRHTGKGSGASGWSGTSGGSGHEGSEQETEHESEYESGD